MVKQKLKSFQAKKPRKPTDHVREIDVYFIITHFIIIAAEHAKRLRSSTIFWCKLDRCMCFCNLDLPHNCYLCNESICGETIWRARQSSKVVSSKREKTERIFILDVFIVLHVMVSFAYCGGYTLLWWGIMLNDDDLFLSIVDVPYEITVFTSDVSNAGTDANVFITIYGMQGMCTEQVDLAESKKKKRKECFNRGSVDTFVREVM